MSFIIQGIDMPKEGNILQLEIHPNGIVWIDMGAEYISGYNVQAIQIPSPHGRLGDLGKLAKLILEFEKSVRESIRGDRIMITEGDLNHAIATLTEHFQEYEPLLEAEE